MSAEEKREARRQRILARGGDRLARITNTGRPEGFVGGDAEPVRRRMAQPEPESAPKPRGPDAERGAAAGPTDLAAAAAAPSAREDPVAQMMAAMNSQAPNANDPMAMLQQLMTQSASAAEAPHAMPSVPNVSPAMLRRAERLDRRMRLLQTSVILLFSLYIVFGSIFAEAPPGILGRLAPTHAVEAYEQRSYRKQWASLAQTYTPMSAWLSAEDPSVFPWGALRTPLDYLRPYLGQAVHPSNLPSWPIFWVFFTLEVALLGIRIAVQQQQPAAPPTGVGSVLRVWAPSLVAYAAPLLSVANLVSALVDDLAILLFAIGAGVLFCHLVG